MAANLNNLKAEIVASLQQLVPQQTFGIVAFESGIIAFSSILMPATASSVTAATNWVQGLQAGGASCMAPAALNSVSLLNSSQDPLRRLFLVSDGLPNCPAARETLVAIANANSQQIPIDTFGYSTEHTAVQFLQDLAAQNGGQFFSVP